MLPPRTMAMRRLAALFLFLLLALQPVFVESEGDELLNVYTFVPFTNNGTTASSISAGTGALLSHTPGFIHMAAALLAMIHFNDRNDTVVLDLKSHTLNCNVTFDIDNSLFFDSGSVTHLASTSWVDNVLKRRRRPSALAGPWNDLPALELSVLAQAARIPIVIQRAFDLRAITDRFSSFAAQVHPDLNSLATALVRYLQWIGRNNYVSVLHPLSDSGLQRRDAIGVALELNDMEWYSDYYIDPQREVSTWEGAASIKTNMQKIKNRGFRTIVVTFDDYFRDLPLLADVAEELAMSNGDWFWFMVGPVDGSHFLSNNTNVTKFLYGSAWIAPLEFPETGSQDPELDYNPFVLSMRSAGSNFSSLVNSKNPISRGMPGYEFAPRTFFQREYYVEYGAGFLYDAIMSIGIGACRAQQGLNSTLDGRSHLAAIRESSFSGASGRVQFRNHGDFPGARDWPTATWGVFNMLPEEERVGIPEFIMTNVLVAGNDTWIELAQFYYADGTTEGPPLISTPEQNYLPDSLKGLGFTLFGLVALVSMGTCLWVFWNRNHAVLRASQPYLLYVLAFGSLVIASAIVPLSFDESDGQSKAQLSVGCMAIPWLVVLGFMFTYCALFCKLWRVQKVLQFKRRTVLIRHVAWPAALLFCAAILVLGLWSGLDPLRWVRETVNQFTKESIGYCRSNTIWAFLGPLLGIVLVPVVLTGFMAWKTRDVDSAYCESWWIFMLILVQFEMALIGAPVLAILWELSTHGRYIGFVVILFAFAISTILLIMLPKWIAFSKAVRGEKEGYQRGAKGNARVTGLTGTSEPEQRTTPQTSEPGTSGSDNAGNGAEDMTP